MNFSSPGRATPAPTVCPGCGIDLPGPSRERPPHGGAAPGCWALYGDLIAREYGEWGNPPIHRLTTNTYFAQHPDPVESRRAISVLAGHLLGLHLWLDRGIEPRRIGGELGRVVARPADFRWLEPPPPGGAITILDVRGADDLRDHATRVERWARSVWESWSDHHETVRRWAGG